MDLHSSRGWVDGAPLAISFSEIAAWSSLTRVRPLPREVRMIRSLDALYRKVLSEVRKRG